MGRLVAGRVTVRSFLKLCLLGLGLLLLFGFTITMWGWNQSLFFAGRLNKLTLGMTRSEVAYLTGMAESQCKPIKENNPDTQTQRCELSNSGWGRWFVPQNRVVATFVNNSLTHVVVEWYYQIDEYSTMIVG